MSPRLKKLLALVVMLPALVIYLFVAAAISERLPDHALARAVYYLVAGVLWAVPIRSLLIWANRDPQPPETSPETPPDQTP